jgi:hypothetical protein
MICLKALKFKYYCYANCDSDFCFEKITIDLQNQFKTNPSIRLISYENVVSTRLPINLYGVIGREKVDYCDPDSIAAINYYNETIKTI